MGVSIMGILSTINITLKMTASTIMMTAIRTITY